MSYEFHTFGKPSSLRICRTRSRVTPVILEMTTLGIVQSTLSGAILRRFLRLFSVHMTALPSACSYL